MASCRSVPQVWVSRDTSGLSFAVEVLDDDHFPPENPWNLDQWWVGDVLCIRVQEDWSAWLCATHVSGQTVWRCPCVCVCVCVCVRVCVCLKQLEMFRRFNN